MQVSDGHVCICPRDGLLFSAGYIHTMYAIRNAFSRKLAPCTTSQANRLRSCRTLNVYRHPLLRFIGCSSHMLWLSSHSPNPVLFWLRTQRLREVKLFPQDGTFWQQMQHIPQVSCKKWDSIHRCCWIGDDRFLLITTTSVQSASSTVLWLWPIKSWIFSLIISLCHSYLKCSHMGVLKEVRKENHFTPFLGIACSRVFACFDI